MNNLHQCPALVQSDVIRLVAFDLMLWIILARLMGAASVGRVARLRPHDKVVDPGSFRIPTYVTDTTQLVATPPA